MNVFYKLKEQSSNLNIMKKLLIFSGITALLASCGGGDNGELVGVYSKSWKEPTPYGMLFVKRGSFTMGQNDQDANWAMTSQSRRASSKLI